MKSTLALLLCSLTLAASAVADPAPTSKPPRYVPTSIVQAPTENPERDESSFNMGISFFGTMLDPDVMGYWRNGPRGGPAYCLQEQTVHRLVSAELRRLDKLVGNDVLEKDPLWKASWLARERFVTAASEERFADMVPTFRAEYAEARGKFEASDTGRDYMLLRAAGFALNDAARIHGKYCATHLSSATEFDLKLANRGLRALTVKSDFVLGWLAGLDDSVHLKRYVQAVIEEEDRALAARARPWRSPFAKPAEDSSND